jgi:hypothetical protein
MEYWIPQERPGSRPRPILASHKTWLAMSFILCVVALFLPFESDTRTVSPGWWKALTGWFFVLAGDTLVWLSGPLALLAWACIALRRPDAAIGFAVGALLIALPFITGPSLEYGWGDHIRRLPQRPELGYFFWLGALAATLISAILLQRKTGDARST